MAQWSNPVPGAPITQRYGVENESYAAGYHTGVDYAVGASTPVGSAAKGTVVQVGSGGAYGNYIIVRHPNGMFTLYAHLKRVGVRKGEKVSEGEQIGLSGNTGNSRGPHLHFEVRDTPEYGSDTNPLRMFGGRQVAVSKGGQDSGPPYNPDSLMGTLYKAGFRGRGLAMAYAIAKAESGGRADEHNPDRSTGDNSYGLFQINMLGAMGAERRDRYNLRNNAELYDPLTNARIAYKMSNGGKNWSAWSTYNTGVYKQYLDEGQAKAARSKGSGGSMAGGGGNDNGTYGYVDAFLDEHPEVRRLVEQAQREGWTDIKLAGEVKDTKWWQNRTEAQRQWDLISAESEAQADKLIDDKADQLRAIFGASGVNIDRKEMKDLARRAAINGWDETEMAAAAAKRFDMTGKDSRGKPITGTAGDVVTAIDEMMFDWGVKVDKHTKERWVKRVLRGEMDVTQMEDKFREQAKALLPSLSKELDTMSTRELVSPYLMVAAEELGIPPEQMSTFDPKWLKPLTGKKEGQRMDMDEWTATIRNDKQYGWDTTSTARQMAAEMALNLGRLMGVA